MLAQWLLLPSKLITVQNLRRLRHTKLSLVARWRRAVLRERRHLASLSHMVLLRTAWVSENVFMGTHCGLNGMTIYKRITVHLWQVRLPCTPRIKRARFWYGFLVSSVHLERTFSGLGITQYISYAGSGLPRPTHGVNPVGSMPVR